MLLARQTTNAQLDGIGIFFIWSWGYVTFTASYGYRTLWHTTMATNEDWYLQSGNYGREIPKEIGMVGEYRLLDTFLFFFSFFFCSRLVYSVPSNHRRATVDDIVESSMD